MNIFHILKNGSVTNDISGRVVRLEDAETIYQLLHKLNTDRKIKKNEYRSSEQLRV